MMRVAGEKSSLMPMSFILNWERADNILSLVLMSLNFTMMGRHRFCENEPSRCAR